MTKTEPNAGYAEGIAKRSKVRQLSYALAGAPKRIKDLRLNAIAAVAEGRKLRDRVTALMLKAEANPDDAMIFCVFAEPDLSRAKDAQPITVQNGASDLALATKFVDKLPIGFLVFVWDKADTEQPIFGHVRALIVEDPRAFALNARALDVVARAVKRALGIEKGN
jgi:hypothetical protein